jgi:membrane-associated phospholipid phosphatase
MNFSDRIYLAVHLGLVLLVCARHDHVSHWGGYLAWDLVSIALIWLLARKQRDGNTWEFLHGWLPALFFVTVFEQVSYLSLSLRGGWQNSYLIGFESKLFGTSPMEWLHSHANNWIIEFLEFGYFAFYPLYPIVGGLFWIWRGLPSFRGAFRRLTDALSTGYASCFAVYLLFPTQSPANRVGVQQIGSSHGGIFQHVVRAIQNNAGVPGNAFPSAHIMLSFVVLMFAYRYLPRLAPWLLFPLLLMCVGAVYDGYHYASDVLAGAALGIALGSAGAFLWGNAVEKKTLSLDGEG